ncbi:MAG: YaaR family protein [Bacilli bacterium]
MKINQGPRLIRDKVRQEPKWDPYLRSKGFGDLLRDSDERMDQENLHKILADIEQQGERLFRSRNVKDLYLYKALIKQFIQEAVQFGVRLEQKQGKDYRGRGKIYKIIHEVDETLLEMTNALIEKESKNIDLLQKIGDIKGMLMNLYM